MSVIDDLYAYLQTKSAVTTVFGTRIFGQMNPSKTVSFPYAVITMVAEERTPHLTAASGLARALYQIDTYGDDLSETLDGANQLRIVLDGFRGDQWNSGTEVRRVVLESVREDLGPPRDGKEEGIYNVSQDYGVWHEETVPTL